MEIKHIQTMEDMSLVREYFIKKKKKCSMLGNSVSLLPYVGTVIYRISFVEVRV